MKLTKRSLGALESRYNLTLIKCAECLVEMTREEYAYGHDCES